ncbi:MAG: lysylphosphatidylglycerol synthase transmembrane domain-containing protein, partial [Gaiellales bacterium]
MHAVWHALRHAHYWWLAPAFVALGAAFVLRSERWRWMFPAEQRPGFVPTFWAFMLGLFANNVLPARLGEIGRMAALSRETGLRRTQVLTTIAVERVFDVAALALIGAVTVPLMPAGSLRRNLTIAIVVIFAALCCMLLALASRRVRRVVETIVRR